MCVVVYTVTGLLQDWHTSTKRIDNFKISAGRDYSHTYSVECKRRRCRLWEKWRVLILPLTRVQTLKITSSVTVGIICNFLSVIEYSPLPNTCNVCNYARIKSGNGITKSSEANICRFCMHTRVYVPHDPWSGVYARISTNIVFSRLAKQLIRVT